MSHLIIKAIKGSYNAETLIKEQTGKYKMYSK